MGATPGIAAEQLLDWLEGRLDQVQAAEVAARAAAAGPATQRRIRWMQAFTSASRSMVIEEPPADLHATLLRQFRPPTSGPLAQLHAALSFDSARQPVAIGVRAPAISSRQLIFTCDLLEVALSVRPGLRGDRLDVNGQVYPQQPHSPAGLVARLSRDEQLVDVVLTSDLGEFSFTSLPPGAYDLELTLEQWQVQFDRFAVVLGTAP